MSEDCAIAQISRMALTGRVSVCEPRSACYAQHNCTITMFATNENRKLSGADSEHASPLNRIRFYPINRSSGLKMPPKAALKGAPKRKKSVKR
jgi:hypothetical protein